jgi:anthranilate synthase component 1
MDTCIALRTLVITDPTGAKRKVYAQVGAGIVADSEPANEYRETLNKAQGLLKAIEVAESWS